MGHLFRWGRGCLDAGLDRHLNLNLDAIPGKGLHFLAADDPAQIDRLVHFFKAAETHHPRTYNIAQAAVPFQLNRVFGGTITIPGPPAKAIERLLGFFLPGTSLPSLIKAKRIPERPRR